MSRSRSFCRFCGALTTYLDACCAAHRDLLAELDYVPPDPLTLLPMQAAQLEREDVSPTEGTESGR
jgi:hypothetical protein